MMAANILPTSWACRYWDSLPLSLPVREAMDAGTVKQMQEAQPAIAEIYTHAAWALALAVADKGKDFSSRFPKIVVE